MDALPLAALVDAAYALGVGLLIGLEREHSSAAGDLPPSEQPADHGVEPDDEPATPLGVRTLALFALTGWATGYVGHAYPWMPALGLVVIGALLTVEYLRRPAPAARDRGLTTEIAGALTYMLGLLVNLERGLAVALALATTLLLISKPWVRHAIVKVRRVELLASVQLLVLLAIVLPLLPAEPVDPWQALPPRKIGLFVALVAGLSFVGYLSDRLVGRRGSALLTGLFGGLASSTALTVTEARRARAQKESRRAAQFTVLLGNAVMLGRVLVITAMLAPPVALALCPPLGAMAAVMLAGAGWRWRGLEKSGGDGPERPPLTNPFALVPALKWGVVLCAVLLIAHLANQYGGARGLYAAALVSGLADVDAITIAATRESAGGQLAAASAALAVTLAVLANTAAKGVLARVAGGGEFARPIAMVFALAMSAAGVTAALLS